ncbi:MAG: tripartite tricarboxylate transporter TctB family protein [Deltaproteobacteria bacterium]|nr:tripartite tricarboxylate transporter TctB family protein [Deltaproteobacteria bacterium]MBW1960401.1 tripartite tricarboxylate transporter TctB family protein [Deltaproteobacteria bacterium]MBW2153433.1 tripartite tricarboxylate transporter TctB family protein [Deltaproteobacteria bacterium]
MNNDQKLGVALILFCIIVWLYAIPHHIVGNAPKFFPRLVIFFILIPAILLIATRRTPDKGPRIRFSDRKGIHKALMTAVFFLIYIALIDVLGYFTSSFLAIMGFLYFFGMRSLTKIVLIPSGILFFIYFVIERMLSFPLPKGMIY